MTPAGALARDCANASAPEGSAADRSDVRAPGRPEGYGRGNLELEPLWLALEEVMDPEIPISLVDLGLIYDIRRNGAEVEVDLTFTATACPCMTFIKFDIDERLKKEPGVETVTIHEVWNPAWTTEMITPRGREDLKKYGVAL